MIAVAGDEIIADPSSIVGSIGVVSASFGLNEAIKKIGVERRVYTAGRNKAVLDPFLPEKPEDVERLKALQLEVHETFIDIVKERRGGQAEGRSGPVHRPVLDRQARHRARPRRRARRHAQHSQGALRAEDQAAADHPAARVVRPPARDFRLERGPFACRYCRRGSRRLARRSRAAVAVEQVRPLKKACNRRYDGGLAPSDGGRPPAIEENAGMPQLIFFALVGAVAYVGYRSFVREADRVTAKVRRTEKQAANGANGTLVKDPEDRRIPACQGLIDAATGAGTRCRRAGGSTRPAKINLALHVVGRRADGYHLLESLAVFTALRRPHRGRAGAVGSLRRHGAVRRGRAARRRQSGHRRARQAARRASRISHARRSRSSWKRTCRSRRASAADRAMRRRRCAR